MTTIGEPLPGTPEGPGSAQGPRTEGQPPGPPGAQSPSTEGQVPGPPGAQSRAAAQAADRDCTRVTLPVIGQVTLPPRDQLAFLGGVGALAIAGIVEWPVAVALGVGHALVQRRQSKTIKAFGEALEKV